MSGRGLCDGPTLSLRGNEKRGIREDAKLGKSEAAAGRAAVLRRISRSGRRAPRRSGRGPAKCGNDASGRRAGGCCAKQ